MKQILSKAASLMALLLSLFLAPQNSEASPQGAYLGHFESSLLQEPSLLTQLSESSMSREQLYAESVGVGFIVGLVAMMRVTGRTEMSNTEFMQYIIAAQARFGNFNIQYCYR